MSLHTPLSPNFRYFVVADILVNRYNWLALPHGKLVRTGILEDILQRLGYAWGDLLPDADLIADLPAKFVEELKEFAETWQGLNLPDNDSPGLRNSGFSKMAEEYADILTLLELARKLLPDAPVKGYVERNAALPITRWLAIHKLFAQGGGPQAISTVGDYLAPTAITLQNFMQREVHQPAWQQVEAVKAKKDREKGVFEGVRVRAVAVFADDPWADRFAANPGWIERPPTDAPSLETALDISTLLMHRTPIA